MINIHIVYMLPQRVFELLTLHQTSKMHLKREFHRVAYKTIVQQWMYVA